MKIWTDRWPTMSENHKAITIDNLKEQKNRATRWLENVCAQLEEIEELEAARKAEGKKP